ncbi:MAG: NfeD family protein [Syntrophales bacterium]|nr:NfeD family protein [Syntrophales bacterium]
MTRNKPDRYTIIRYTLVQVPGLALVLVGVFFLLHYTDWSPWLIWTGFALWVVKDVLLFFLLWPSYHSSARDADPLIGQVGQVVKPCDPRGTVEIHGTLWWAVAEETDAVLPPGTRIRVIRRSGMTLFVESENGETGTNFQVKSASPAIRTVGKARKRLFC